MAGPDSGQGLLTLREHAERLTSVCLSADQRTVLSDERTIRLWDTASGQCLRVSDEQPGRANAVRLGADGRFALSGHSGSPVRLRDVGSGRRVRVLDGHRTGVVGVARTPDGRIEAAVSDAAARSSPVGFQAAAHSDSDTAAE